MFTLGRGNIYYEDESLLIINKPAGMLVHPTVKEDGGTLYNHVKRYYEKNNIESGLHPVSRLDRNTSGLVIFAKQPRVQFLLSQQQVVKNISASRQRFRPHYADVLKRPLPAGKAVLLNAASAKAANTPAPITRCWRQTAAKRW